MKVRCLHGFFIFEETACGQISDFMKLTGIDLVRTENHFTFSFLENAPRYSIKGNQYLGFMATKTIEGDPWTIFEANEVVYRIDQDALGRIDSLNVKVRLENVGNCFVSDGLIQPGSVTEDGDRVRDYSAWYSRASQRWLYSEVTFV